jgi:GT2 family glycosyltransferase
MLDNKHPKVFLIILNYNGKSDTINCLNSILAADIKNAQIVVVDNASSDGSVKAVKDTFPNIHLIKNQENLGYAGGNNVGIQYAYKQNADYIFILNNDIKVASNFLEEILKLAKEKPNGGIFGSAIYQYDNPNKLEHLGGYYNSSICEFISNKTLSDKAQKVDYVCGCAILIKREVIEKVGLFEPKFFLLWEESDFCFRAQKKGFEIWVQPLSKIWHKISASFKDGKPQMQYFWWRNRLFWISRNLNKQEKKKAYINVIIPEIIKTYKHLFLKKIHLILSISKKKRTERKEKYYRLKAAGKGIKDYFFNKFGNTYKKV